MAQKGKVGIVGSGFIGRGWAMVFASAGYHVCLYDNDSSIVDEALDDIKQKLKNLEDAGLLRGKLSAAEQCGLIFKSRSLKECVQNSVHVQECVFENLDVKKDVFQNLDKVASNTVVLCSSTSCFPASSFSENLVHRSQVIVGHPVNPVYYVPVVEIVPAPWTDPEVVSRTSKLMVEIGQKPVTLKKEVLGFVLNRMQYALQNECWRLVQDGFVSLEDLEICMFDGLGPLYAFIGPLEYSHLNAEGLLDYCSRYGNGTYNVSQTFGPNPRMDGAAAKWMSDEMYKISPLEKIVERRRWRDAQLAALSKMKQQLNVQE